MIVLFLTSCDSVQDEEVEVVRYNGPEINWETVPNWTASIDDGVVSLHFSYTESFGENGMLEGKDLRDIESGEMLTLSLMDNGTQLPMFISAARSLAPGFEGTYKALRTGPMHSGTIQVQEWNIGGAIRSRIVGKVGYVTEIDVYFLADLEHVNSVSTSQ